MAWRAVAVDGGQMPSRKPRAKRSTALLFVAQPCALFLLFLSVGLIVRAPYREAFFWADDIMFLREIGLQQTGKLTFSDYLFAPEFGAHYLPLGKLIFFGQWYGFGLATANWRLVAEITQAASALFLFQLLRFYGAGAVGALCGAIAWSGAAIGGLDSPLTWLMCLHWALSLTFILGAMVAITNVLQRPLLVPGLVFLLIGAALLTWSNCLAALVVVPLQVLTLQRFAGIVVPFNLLRRLALAVLGAGALFGLLPALLLVAGALSGGRPLHLSPLQLLQRTSVQAITSLATLLYDYPRLLPLVAARDEFGLNHCRDCYNAIGPQEPAETLQQFPHRFAGLNSRIAALESASSTDTLADFLVPAGVAVGLLLASCVLGTTSQRGLLGLLFGMAVIQTLFINFGSTGNSLAEAGGFTHYKYYATLPWCACLGVITDALVRWLTRLGMARLGVLCFVPFGFVLVHQWRVAEDGRQSFDAAASTDMIINRWYLEVLERFTQNYLAGEPAMRLPELQVSLSNLTEEHFPLSAYVALVHPDGVPGIEVVPCSELTEAEWNASYQAVNRMKRLAGEWWSRNLVGHLELTRAVNWLNDQARMENRPVAIPDMKLSSLVTVRLSSFLNLSYGKLPSHFQIIPVESYTEAQWQELFDRVQGPPHPDRQFWIDQLQHFRKLPKSAPRSVEQTAG